MKEYIRRTFNRIPEFCLELMEWPEVKEVIDIEFKLKWNENRNGIRDDLKHS